MDSQVNSNKTRGNEILTFQKFDIRVISGNNPNYSSEEELEDALLEEKSVIVIKDPDLGRKTVLWMGLGNCIHHMTLLTAIGTAICCSGIHDSLYCLRKPLAIASILTNLGYKAIWSPFPLNKYRFAPGTNVLNALRKSEESSNVLVHKEDQSNRCTDIIYSVASLIAFGLGFWFDEPEQSTTENGDTSEVVSDVTEPQETSTSFFEEIKEAFKKPAIDSIQVITQGPDIFLPKKTSEVMLNTILVRDVEQYTDTMRMAACVAAAAMAFWKDIAAINFRAIYDSIISFGRKVAKKEDETIQN